MLDFLSCYKFPWTFFSPILITFLSNFDSVIFYLRISISLYVPLYYFFFFLFNFFFYYCGLTSLNALHVLIFPSFLYGFLLPCAKLWHPLHHMLTRHWSFFTQAQVGGNPTFHSCSPIVSKTNSTHYFHLDFTHVRLVPTFLFHGTLQSTNGNILGFGLLFIIHQLRYFISFSLVLEIM
jgi:hypothetical protein